MQDLLLVAGATPIGGLGPANSYADTYYMSENATGFEHQIINLPMAGYRGEITIWMAGASTAIGEVFDGLQGSDASGQSAKFHYACQGDEESFSLIQTGSYNESGHYLEFRVDGGVNDGHYFRVGSGGGINSMSPRGNAAAPQYYGYHTTFQPDAAVGGAWADSSTTVDADGNQYWADGYPYGPPNNNSVVVETFDTFTTAGGTVLWDVTVHGGEWPGGLRVEENGGFTRYIGRAAQYTGVSYQRSPDGKAGVLIYWR